MEAKSSVPGVTAGHQRVETWQPKGAVIIHGLFRLLGWLMVVAVLGLGIEFFLYDLLELELAVFLSDEWEYEIGFLVALLIVLFGFNRTRLRDLGLGWLNFRKFFFPGIGVGSMILAAYVAVLFLSGAATDFYLDPDFFFTLLFGGPLVFLFALDEELLFRGMVFRYLKGSLLAVMSVSVFFDMVMHLDFSAGAILFHLISAAGFAYMYLWTGSLWFSAGVHTGWNLGHVIYLIDYQYLVADNTSFVMAALVHLAGLILIRAVLKRKGYRCDFAGTLNGVSHRF